MKCGEFRAKADKRISIQSKSVVEDDFGGRAVTWTEVVAAWAIINPVQGREPYEQDQLQSRVKNKMTIRYQSSLKDTEVTATYRVVFDGRVYPIQYIHNLAEDMKREGRAYQVLFCEQNYPSEEG